MKHPRPSNQAGPRHAIPAEPITPGQLWPLSFLHTKCGYGARARARMIQEGLPVLRWGKRSWILTDDLIRFLQREGQRAADEGASHSESGRKVALSHETSDGNGKVPP